MEKFMQYFCIKHLKNEYLCIIMLTIDVITAERR